MPINVYQKLRIDELKERAAELQKTGMTVRQIGFTVGRSPAWVSLAVREIEKKNKQK